jgi:hypothetical protein
MSAPKNIVRDIATDAPEKDCYPVDENGVHVVNYEVRKTERVLRSLEALNGRFGIDEGTPFHVANNLHLNLAMFGNSASLRRVYDVKRNTNATGEVYHCHIGSNPTYVAEWQVDTNGVVTLLQLEPHENFKFAATVDEGAAARAEKSVLKRASLKLQAKEGPEGASGRPPGTRHTRLKHFANTI